ncbi:helix-turn-helix transcriptional regulator [Amycolatopsis sp. NPDC049688]|uniref:helix-turn-helix transcriptional regulator n=1 Tax=Amycolatopsis sp. NPDC049688 TaxID=3154733 RepID=UPI003425015F
MDEDEHRRRMLQKFGGELRQLREDHDPRLTQQEAADVAGVSRPAYSRWERGESLAEQDGIARLDEHYELAGNLVARWQFLGENQRMVPQLRQWAAPGKPPLYAGEMYLLLRTMLGAAPLPAVEVSVDVDGRWRLVKTLGPVDEIGVAIAGTDPDAIRRNIEVVTSEPVLIGLYRGYPALPPERVTGVRMVDWLVLPPRGTAPD